MKFIESIIALADRKSGKLEETLVRFDDFDEKYKTFRTFMKKQLRGRWSNPDELFVKLESSIK